MTHTNHTPQFRKRRGHAAEAAPTPGLVPTVQHRAGQLAALGWSGREAEWLALVALHSGVFTRSQCGAYFEAGDDRKPAGRFVRALVEKQLASEDERAIFPGGARAVLLTGKPIYRALGIPDVRHRRGKDATTQVLMRRLLSLDYLIDRPSLGWLPTEADKVQRFEALGIDRGTFPYRMYGPHGKPMVPRYFAFKLPIAVDAQAATFVYVDAGQTTDSELRAWGVAHAPLWAALRARTFAVHVVAVGTGAEAADRAAPVLTRWTQDGDGQGAGQRQWYAQTGGVYQKEKGGCTTPPSIFPPALFGFVVLDRPTRTAPAERRDGSDPLFFTAGAVRRGVGCTTRCTTGGTVKLSSLAAFSPPAATAKSLILSL